MSPSKEPFVCLEYKKVDFNFHGDGDFSGFLKFLAGAFVGAAGALASWFNDIVNGEAKFNLANCMMLLFIGATIGIVANIAAPMFGINEHYTVVFACAAASAHKYIFRYATRIIDKWVSK